LVGPLAAQRPPEPPPTFEVLLTKLASAPADFEKRGGRWVVVSFRDLLKN